MLYFQSRDVTTGRPKRWSRDAESKRPGRTFGVGDNASGAGRVDASICRPRGYAGRVSFVSEVEQTFAKIGEFANVISDSRHRRGVEDLSASAVDERARARHCRDGVFRQIAQLLKRPPGRTESDGAVAGGRRALSRRIRSAARIFDDADGEAGRQDHETQSRQKFSM